MKTVTTVFFFFADLIFELIKNVMEIHSLRGNLSTITDSAFLNPSWTPTTMTLHDYQSYQHAQTHTAQTHHTSFEHFSISST